MENPLVSAIIESKATIDEKMAKSQISLIKVKCELVVVDRKMLLINTRNNFF